MMQNIYVIIRASKVLKVPKLKKFTFSILAEFGKIFKFCYYEQLESKIDNLLFLFQGCNISKTWKILDGHYNRLIHQGCTVL